jgi:hypothetical protein
LSEHLNWIHQCRAEVAKTFTKLIARKLPDPHVTTENGPQ